ncbi:MAG: hypothetical protein JOY90_24845 [Bradyrhizobium sp.]|uniref:hypothetical protein n=1 Tax=Bradyrhizobium sp. TaxID=376 RepID=UPI001D43281C|nr:hypothetical protein [Bradyrhizobium sp.]MBV9563644.1 hypothetical protein [Bradyrhizobium sp.]
MPASPDREGPRRSLLVGSVAALLAAGYSLTLWMFYPGVMTYDARFVHEDIAKGTLGDWQSPVMTWLWGLIDPIAPGPGSMFLLTATTYWLGFALLTLALAARARRVALVLPILALAPPALAFVGIIWRDVLFAASWLLAASIAFVVAERPAPIERPAQGLALAFVTFGVLLRPNALLAAPILAAYVAWPAQFSLRRSAILFVPLAVGFYIAVQLIYYGALGAVRQHPLQTIMIFDLGGISHFAKENQYPVDWNTQQGALLLNGCYQPTQWDIYWRLEPCEFVMDKIERELHLFGTSAIPKAWLLAIARHPLAYLRHRSAFMWNFLAADNLTMWVADIEHPDRQVFADRKAFTTLVAAHDALKSTPLLRVGTWLVACIMLSCLGWRQRGSAEAAFVLGVCGSAAIYVLTFLFVGVASDFRYGYWAVLATMAASVVAASGRPARSYFPGPDEAVQAL